MHNEPNDALILAPIGRDAKVAAAILAEEGYSSVICSTLAGTLDAIDACYCLVVTEEALLAEDHGVVPHGVERVDLVRGRARLRARVTVTV